MFSSIANVILTSVSDMTQNPVSITIFGILTLVVISLAIAIVSPGVRDFLVHIKLLEEDEEPSSLLFWIIGIIILVKLVQAFLIQPFIVDGASMLPTYHNQEFLLVDKFSYRVEAPKRGDIMIFKLYENNNNPYEGKHLIKRVIGLPSERVTVHNGVTTIYNKENPKGFILPEPFVLFKETTKDADMTLDDHHYFMMGDNRAQSYDSRDWGALDAVNIKGQVLFRVYPFKQAGYEPGRYSFTK
jgi:signal peptidase I